MSPIFAPPENHDEGSPRGTPQSAEGLEFPVDEEAGDGRSDVVCHPHHGCVSSVRAAKCIVDEHIAEPGESLGKGRVVGRLARQKTRVFQENHLTRSEISARLDGFVRIGGRHEPHGHPQLLRQHGGHRGERHRRHDLSLGTAQVRKQDRPPTTLHHMPQGGQGRTHARDVGHRPIVRQRYVVVDSYQDAAPVQVRGRQVVQVPSKHNDLACQRLCPMVRARSTHRVEYPHSLSYQEITFTMRPPMTDVERPSMIELCGLPT